MGRPFFPELQMRVVALKDLTYSPDGIRIEAAQKDQEFDCPDGIVADYVAAGLIGPPGPPRSSTHQGGSGNQDVGNGNLDGQDGKPAGENDNPPAPDPVAAAKAAEADAAPKHPKAARKPKSD
jgi:hypothetical protein